MAWPTPPPSERGLTLRIDDVRNVQLITAKPFTSTVKITDTRGTIAAMKVE